MSFGTRGFKNKGKNYQPSLTLPSSALFFYIYSVQFEFFLISKRYIKAADIKELMGAKFIVIASILVMLLLIDGCSIYMLTKEQEQQEAPKKVHTKNIIQPQKIEANKTNVSVSSQSTLKIGSDVGDMAPDFVFQLLFGEVIIKQRQLKEEPVIIYFFTTYCQTCQDELSEMKKIYPTYKNRIRFIAMDIDHTEDINVLEKYAKAHPSIAGIIDIAPSKEEVLVKFEVTQPGIKIGINKDGVIAGRENEMFKSNDWRDLFEKLV